VSRWALLSPRSKLLRLACRVSPSYPGERFRAGDRLPQMFQDLEVSRRSSVIDSCREELLDYGRSAFACPAPFEHLMENRGG
jgi:hypothetical protein